MNSILLIFFAIPLAVIIFSIALQKLLKCPLLVSAIVFAIGIIITFIVSNLIFLAATLAYTFISYITAVITCICSRYLSNNRCRREDNCNRDSNNLLTISSHCGGNEDDDLLTINSNCADGNTSNLLTISSNNRNACCNYHNETCDNDRITTRINVIPNTTNNGRTGCICGRYRRR